MMNLDAEAAILLKQVERHTPGKSRPFAQRCFRAALERAYGAGYNEGRAPRPMIWPTPPVKHSATFIPFMVAQVRSIG